MSKPRIFLNEANPNIFEILGKASKELPLNQKNEMADRVMHAKSYNEARNIIKEYVDILYMTPQYFDEEGNEVELTNEEE